jgi:DNA-binding LytR/AlgR family response regulator
VDYLKVEVKIDEALEENKIVIFTNKVTNEVEEIINKFKDSQNKVYTGTRDQKIYLLNPKDIFYFYAENQKVLMKTEDQTLQVKLKLYEIEEQINGTNFVRISNSVIANIDKIKNFEISLNGTLCIKFINGDTEYSSRRYVSKIKKYLGL